MIRVSDCLRFTVVAFVVLGGVARAEEFLIQKAGGKFLGWRIDKDKFETCQKDKLEVAGGKVSPTTEKCDTKIPPPFIFSAGTVQHVDAANSKVKVLTQGDSVELLMKDPSTKKIAAILKPGDKVEMKYSTGREPAAVFIEKKM
jgi:hypothetical protein